MGTGHRIIYLLWWKLNFQSEQHEFNALIIRIINRLKKGFQESATFNSQISVEERSLLEKNARIAIFVTLQNGPVAERLGRALQKLVHQFESGRDLFKSTKAWM